MRYIQVLLLLLFLCKSRFAVAQQKDSLEKVLLTANDTERVNILLRIAFNSVKEQLYEKAENKFLEAEKEAAKLKDKHFLFDAVISHADYFYRRGNFPTSMEKAEEALEIAETGKNEIEIAEAQNLIGMNTGRFGDFKGALEHYQKALPVFEKNKLFSKLYITITNIAGIYFDQQEFDLAIDYFKKALKIAEERKNQKQIGQSLNNIAAALHNQGKNEEAKSYYLEAVAVNKACGNMGNLGYNYMNLAGLELENKNIEGARNFNKMAWDLLEKEGDNYSMVEILWQSADLERVSGNKAKSLKILENATRLAEATGSPLILERTLKQLAAAYTATGDYKKAALTFERYIITKDSIVNDEIRNAVTKKQLRFEFDKLHMKDSIKQTMQVAQLNEKIETGKKEASQQRIILLISLGALALLGVLMVVVYRSYQQNKKSSLIISKQKEKVEEQKQFLEVKNKEIVDSINYAKSIQEAILPEQKTLSQLLNDYFIFFQPRDIVSGDFYWTAEKNDYVFLAVADCTGHGVPGAFMSMLGVSLLNEIVIEKGIDKPGKILDTLRERIILALKQEEGANKHKDGMDIALIRINRKKNELVFSSAVNKAILFLNGELTVIRGDSQPVGLSFGEARSFSEQTFTFGKGDMIYLMTDGISDQFGGASGKKFKFRKLVETINSYKHLNSAEQMKSIRRVFEEWKTGYDQVDDICMMGLRL